MAMIDDSDDERVYNLVRDSYERTGGISDEIGGDDLRRSLLIMYDLYGDILLDVETARRRGDPDSAASGLGDAKRLLDLYDAAYGKHGKDEEYEIKRPDMASDYTHCEILYRAQYHGDLPEMDRETFDYFFEAFSADYRYYKARVEKGDLGGDVLKETWQRELDDTMMVLPKFQALQYNVIRRKS